MSTDAAFAELTYPSLGSAGQQEEFERARVRGHAAGYAAGLRRAEADAAVLESAALAERNARAVADELAIAAALAALSTAVTGVQNVAELVLADADAALAAAAIELAEVILARELDDGAASAKAALARAMAVVDRDEVMAVRLNPEDLSVMQSQQSDAAGVRFVADPSLDRGDAVLDLPHGRVDARISAALQRARTEILGGAL